jgi:hypothetical protein
MLCPTIVTTALLGPVGDWLGEGLEDALLILHPMADQRWERSLQCLVSDTIGQGQCELAVTVGGFAHSCGPGQRIPTTGKRGDAWRQTIQRTMRLPSERR